MSRLLIHVCKHMSILVSLGPTVSFVVSCLTATMTDDIRSTTRRRASMRRGGAPFRELDFVRSWRKNALPSILVLPVVPFVFPFGAL